MQTIDWRADLTHAVFYRLRDDPVALPIRVFIAGAYQATLLPGMFTELCVSAGTQVIHLADPRSINSAVFTLNPVLAPRQSHFFRIAQEAGDKVNFLEVSPEQALQEASSVNRVRTLTRVSRSQNCRQPA